MTIESTLHESLDLFAGLCAVGDLGGITVESIQGGHHLSARVTGKIWWMQEEYPISVWTGLRDGTISGGGADATWLQIRDEAVDIAHGPFAQTVMRLSPAKFLPHLTKAVELNIALYDAAMDVLQCAETQGDLDALLQELSRLAGEARSLVEHRGYAQLAHNDILLNCANTILGGITVSESPDVPHAFELNADTLDPATNAKAKIKVGWIKVPGTSNYTHSYQIGEARCFAHDDDDIDQLMQNVQPESRRHYLHAFDHLHQAAHAVGDYANGKVGEAVAEASAIDEPLSDVERHQIAHETLADVLVELNQFISMISVEPGPEIHGHEH